MKSPIRIGVLVNRDRDRTLTTWQPTADYLSHELSDYQFEVVPLDFHEIETAVAANCIEFIITSPGIYVEFETLYGVNRLATLKRVRLGQVCTLFGGVIFCNADRHDIQHLQDLRGKHLIAVAENSFGGWRSTWREMAEVGLNPYRDCQSLRFGQSHDAVVYAVQQGQADVGTVSTNILEQMAIEGKINLQNIRILNPQLYYGDSFPFVVSTRLYPEWPFAVTRHTPGDLAEQVAIALLKLPKHHPAAIAAGSEGWTIPLNYQPIHECFQALQVHPYKDFGRTTSSFELAVKGSNDGLWDWNLETNEVFFSARWKAMLGYAESDIANHFEEWQKRLHPDDRDRVLSVFQQCFDQPYSTCELEYRLQHRHGYYLWILCRATLLRDVWNKPYRMAGSHTDITQRKQAEEELRQSEYQLKQQTQQLQQALSELKRTQLQLIHSEKMSSLGQLVAGIAHEINNPVNFIHGNLSHLDRYVEDLLNFAEVFKRSYPDPIPDVQRVIEQIDLDFIHADLPQLLQSMRSGTQRIQSIVASLRSFSRLDEAEIKTVDLHEGLETTLLLLNHRLKAEPGQAEIRIQREYGNIPPVECYAGQLNQVFINILSNAIEALTLTRSSSPTTTTRPTGRGLVLTTNPIPTIVIQTDILESRWAIVRITDNGSGIPPHIKHRIFDPFFTTKPVGQGTGLGLAICYHTIVKHHAGQLHCHSEPGQSTTFEIRIPLEFAVSPLS